MFELRARRNMAGWDRAITLGVGTALVVHAWRRKRWISPAATAGAALIARGASGYCPAYAASGIRSRQDAPARVLSGAGGMKLKESVTIARPPSEVFNFWRAFENLPTFVAHLVSVESLDDQRTRWTFTGPAGIPLRWDAIVINEIAGELIAWKSAPGSDVITAGSVAFKPGPRDGTEVTVSMQYSPPGGKVAAAAAWLAGRAPASELREDLRRLKRLLEAGELPTTDGQAAGPRSFRFRALQQVVS